MGQSICFIGNSHLVAFKLAWDELKTQVSGISIDMFGAAMDSLRSVDFADGRIVPTSERVRNGFAMTAAADSIDLKRYDSFCIVACGFDLGAIISQFETYTFYGSKMKAPNLTSYEAFESAAHDRLNDVTASHILKLIRRASNAPVTVFPQPFRSEAILTVPHPRGKHDLWKAVVQSGEDVRTGKLFDKLCQQFAREAGVRVVAQSEATRSGPILSKRIYNEDAVRLQPGFSTPHKRNDCTHMNKAYGLTTLRQFFQAP